MVGLGQCLLVLELKNVCQNFSNVSYTQSPLSLGASPTFVLSETLRGEKKKTNAALIESTQLEKHGTIFRKPRASPFFRCVSGLASDNCWHSASNKVPLFHLTLRCEPSICAEGNTAPVLHKASTYEFYSKACHICHSLTHRRFICSWMKQLFAQLSDLTHHHCSCLFCSFIIKVHLSSKNFTACNVARAVLLVHETTKTLYFDH